MLTDFKLSIKLRGVWTAWAPHTELARQHESALKTLSQESSLSL